MSAPLLDRRKFPRARNPLCRFWDHKGLPKSPTDGDTAICCRCGWQHVARQFSYLRSFDFYLTEDEAVFWVPLEDGELAR